jgi:Flp pilus assembly protein TadG
MKMNIDRCGLAALEFALVTPVLITLAMGLYDLVAATTTWWHLTQAAQAIGQIASSTAANPNQTNTLTKTQAYNASTAIYPLVPQLTSNSASIFSVVLTGVVFTPTVAGCTASCQYTAAVAWSHTLLGIAAARSCGALLSVADSAAPSPATLPADMFSSAPLLVVDVSFTFQPVFRTFVKAAFPMARTAYVPMRIGLDIQWMRYIDPADPTHAMCAGFS